MTPYQRVVEALKGTSLESRLAAIAMEMGLRDDAPEWSISVATLIGCTPLLELNEHLEARITGTISNAIQTELSAKWRDSLGAAIAGAVVASAATQIAEPTQKAVAEVTTRAKQFIAACDERTQRLLLWRMPGQALLFAALLAALLVGGMILGAYRLGKSGMAASYRAGELYAVTAEARCFHASHHLCNSKGK